MRIPFKLRVFNIGHMHDHIVKPHVLHGHAEIFLEGNVIFKIGIPANLHFGKKCSLQQIAPELHAHPVYYLYYREWLMFADYINAIEQLIEKVFLYCIDLMGELVYLAARQFCIFRIINGYTTGKRFIIGAKHHETCRIWHNGNLCLQFREELAIIPIK